jgi:hypothetical protein
VGRNCIKKVLWAEQKQNVEVMHSSLVALVGYWVPAPSAMIPVAAMLLQLGIFHSEMQPDEDTLS